MSDIIPTNTPVGNYNYNVPRHYLSKTYTRERTHEPLWVNYTQTYTFNILETQKI